jgi:O-antigen ligase
VGYLVAIALQLLILFSGIGFEGYLPPLAKLIPGDKLSLMVTLAEYQPFFGISLPRTVLYMPDPPVTGIGALLFFFICLGESRPQLKRWALIGCSVALLISFSRLAWLCFPVALMLLYSFHLTWLRQSFLWGISVISLLSGLSGMSLIDLGGRSLSFFNSARAESSADREFVIQKTLDAWLERPWLGWGLIRDSVRWHIYDVVLGSFSTYSSVLYLHGVFGFAVFITALLLTIAQFLTPALHNHIPSQRAFACFIVLCILCQGIPFSWLVVYIWVFFLWLGAVIQDYSPKPTLNLNLPRLQLD